MTDADRTDGPAAETGLQTGTTTASSGQAPGEQGHRQVQEDVPLEELEGELVLWRVFGLSDVFEDRPVPHWSIEEGRGPSHIDRLRISIGDVPEDLCDALVQWRAQVPCVLNAHVGHPQTYGEIEEGYERGLSEEPPTPFVDPYPLWFTMRLSRPTRQRVVGGGLIPLWFTKEDFDAVEQEMELFEDKGNRYLDGALARMVGSLPPINVGALRLPGREAWLLVPGRAAWRVPRPQLKIRDSGVQVGRAEGWAATVPVAELAGALVRLPSGDGAATLGKQTAKAATFFASARAVAESDDLGRFVYAFAGLELLATQVEIQGREILLSQLAALDNAVPFRQLLWPTKGDDWAERNLIFRFAVMAALHSPDTAAEDTELCKKIALTRNSLFHGKELGSDLRSHGVACAELLRRYLGLVAASEARSTTSNTRPC